MIIKTLNMGVFQVNSYLVTDEGSKEAVLIDAGGDYDATIKAAQELGVEIKYLLNTHAHMDHIAGDEELQRKNGVKVFLNKEDEVMLGVFKQYLKMFGMPDYEVPKIDEYLEDGQELIFDNLKFKVISTPGHSNGGVSFLIDDILFSGDTIFFESVGRTDLYGGDYKKLENSIKTKIFTLDDNVKIYPGHGQPTTVGNEKKNNPYIKP